MIVAFQSVNTSPAPAAGNNTNSRNHKKSGKKDNNNNSNKIEFCKDTNSDNKITKIVKEKGGKDVVMTKKKKKKKKTSSPPPPPRRKTNNTLPTKSAATRTTTKTTTKPEASTSTSTIAKANNKKGKKDKDKKDHCQSTAKATTAKTKTTATIPSPLFSSSAELFEVIDNYDYFNDNDDDDIVEPVPLDTDALQAMSTLLLKQMGDALARVETTVSNHPSLTLRPTEDVLDWNASSSSSLEDFHYSAATSSQEQQSPPKTTTTTTTTRSKINECNSTKYSVNRSDIFFHTNDHNDKEQGGEMDTTANTSDTSTGSCCAADESDEDKDDDSSSSSSSSSSSDSDSDSDDDDSSHSSKSDDDDSSSSSSSSSSSCSTTSDGDNINSIHAITSAVNGEFQMYNQPSTKHNDIKLPEISLHLDDVFGTSLRRSSKYYEHDDNDDIPEESFHMGSCHNSKQRQTRRRNNYHQHQHQHHSDDESHHDDSFHFDELEALYNDHHHHHQAPGSTCGYNSSTSQFGSPRPYHNKKRRESLRSSFSHSSVTLSSFHRSSILGEGQFGEVWLVQPVESFMDEMKKHNASTIVEEIDNNEEFALKIQSKDCKDDDDNCRPMSDYTVQEAIQRECDILSQLCDHPFIVELVHNFEDDENMYMVMGAIKGVELWDCIHRKNNDNGHESQATPGALQEEAWVSGISEEYSKFLSLLIADTLHFMHQKKICYRDLKPENVMINEMGYPILVDFGFAKKILPNNNNEDYNTIGEESDDEKYYNIQYKTFTMCGTPKYTAPEIIAEEGHSFAVDNWALGIVIYEMLTGEHPFYYEGISDMQLFEDITNNEPYPIQDHGSSSGGGDKQQQIISQQAKDIVRDLLRKDPLERLFGKDIISHPWFEGIDLDEARDMQLPSPWTPSLKT